MTISQADWNTAEKTSTDGPSTEFIRAVAQLLETDPEDILAELGYSHPDEQAMAVSEL